MAAGCKEFAAAMSACMSNADAKPKFDALQKTLNALPAYLLDITASPLAKIAKESDIAYKKAEFITKYVSSTKTCLMEAMPLFGTLPLELSSEKCYNFGLLITLDEANTDFRDMTLKIPSLDLVINGARQLVRGIGLRQCHEELKPLGYEFLMRLKTLKIDPDAALWKQTPDVGTWNAKEVLGTSESIGQMATFTAVLKSHYSRIFQDKDFIKFEFEAGDAKKQVQLALPLVVMAPWFASVILKIDAMEDKQLSIADLAQTCMPDMDKFMIDYKEVNTNVLTNLQAESPFRSILDNVLNCFTNYSSVKCDHIITTATQEI